VSKSKKPSPLLYVPHQKDNICHHLCSLCLYSMHFSKKMTSMSPSPTYVRCASTMCISLRRQCQCHHHQPTLFLFLLCAPFQEDTINTTIINIAQVTNAINYFLPWIKNFLTYYVCMLLDSGLQLRMRVVFVLCACLLAFFPRFLLGFGLHSVWWKKCWIKSST
jgi:hypothetical protein